MAPTDGSRAVYDRYLEPCSSTVGLPTRGSRCRDDACISGIFDQPSLPTIYRSSGDGETGTETGAAATTGTTATAPATATGPALVTAGANSSMADGSRPRCRKEWYRIGEA